MKTAQQPAGKSSKHTPFGTYEQLENFNHHCQAAIGLIEALASQRIIRPPEGRYYQAVLRELRSSISQSVMESFGPAGGLKLRLVSATGSRGNVRSDGPPCLADQAKTLSKWKARLSLLGCAEAILGNAIC